MAQRRRGSTASVPTPQTSLSDLLADLPEPSKSFEPIAQRTYPTVRAEQEAWIKATNRWGR